MKRNRRVAMISVAMILTVTVFNISTTQCKWVKPPEVPADRLLKNVGVYIEAHPKDANGYYILGRLHSLLFAIDTKTIVSEELKAPALGPGAESAISLESAQGILRIFGKRPLNPAETEEAKKLRGAIAKIEQTPRVVTPIVFSLSDQPATLADLLEENKIVRFDLDGDGRTEWWPWVNAETGILVWDPKGKGRIESGVQLFGSVTWWMSWRNGYEPLASLDDDRDGFLCGSELKGIAVWQDRNGNGISDRGEVVPATSRGIVEIAVTPNSGEVAPWNAAGIRWRDQSYQA
jgi:hypothetical protein